MIVYIPQRIETAEQAEALPVGTVASLYDPSFGDPAIDLAALKVAGNSWSYTSDDEQFADADMAGWTALVPIEAEEETTRAEPFADGTIHVSPQYWRDEPSRRLVTPWEPVSGPDRRGDCA